MSSETHGGSGAGGEAARRQARENARLVEAAFREFAENGPEAAVDYLDPGVEVYSEQTFANAGRFHGVPGYLRWSARWFDAWEEFNFDIELIEPVGESHVVVTCRQAARGKASGAPVEMRATYMFELEAGRAVRFHIYNERAEAIAAARRGEERAAREAGPPR
ncbi:MAG: nuclear transport factor 2 family protein [Solirubrobacterales bacterium]